MVSRLRKALGCKKAGHAGTLDRFATGLLILPVGSGTPLADYFLHQDKDYIATFQFGAFTDTHDPEGTVLDGVEDDVSREFLEKNSDQIAGVIDSFVGELDQVPPVYSALKTGGRRFSDLARSGKSMEPPARRVQIFQSRVEGLDPANRTLQAFFSVSSGTYIRSIARDLSEKLNFPLHLSGLRRTRIGRFSIQDPRVWSGEGPVDVISPLEALPDWPVLTVTDPRSLVRLSHGNPIDLIGIPPEGTDFFMVDGEGEPLAWGRSGGDHYKYRRVFLQG